MLGVVTIETLINGAGRCLASNPEDQQTATCESTSNHALTLLGTQESA